MRGSDPVKQLILKSAKFKELKNQGIDGLAYSGGRLDPQTYSRVGKIAKSYGLGFQAWIPTMVQSKEGLLDHSLFMP
ncbi:MAG: hypothetical protein R2744_08775 [Bacteroidales bacterium]